MKKVTLIAMLLVCAIAMAQIETVRFEEPEVFSGDYTDTGNPNESHDLVNNSNQPLLNFSSTGGDLGFNARYEPYDTPGDGLTDGDDVGVTDNSPSGNNPFPDGTQGYQISDVDGNFILEFDPILSTSTAPNMTIDYFIAETGFEGDGTVNESGSDRLRIYVRHLEENTEYDILDTTGNDINDLGIEGVWNTGFVELPPFVSTPHTFQMVIEVRCNSGAEAFYFDMLQFNGQLAVVDFDTKPFSIFPNPASEGYINILSEKYGLKNIRIYNLLGQQLINTTLTNEHLAISSLSSGLYIVKISQGESSATKKLVVK